MTAATIANPGRHSVLPSVATHYPAELELGPGMAPGGYDTCYGDCPACDAHRRQLREYRGGSRVLDLRDMSWSGDAE